jgi:hypothetical protein
MCTRACVCLCMRVCSVSVLCASSKQANTGFNNIYLFQVSPHQLSPNTTTQSWQSFSPLFFARFGLFKFSPQITIHKGASSLMSRLMSQFLARWRPRKCFKPTCKHAGFLCMPAPRWNTSCNTSCSCSHGSLVLRELHCVHAHSPMPMGKGVSNKLPQLDG